VRACRSAFEALLAEATRDWTSDEIETFPRRLSRLDTTLLQNADSKAGRT
jgi:hypothetical protein